MTDCEIRSSRPASCDAAERQLGLSLGGADVTAWL